MQESKINSTLKIGIKMVHLEGTRDYFAPALRSAPVFGGIAGIISSSDPAATASTNAQHSEAAARGAEGEDAEASAVPNLSMNSANGKEVGEMQDMYRKTLSAYWNSQPGELKADECIEDIFAGGDGWGKGGRPSAINTSAANQQSLAGGGGGSSHPGSGASTPNFTEEHLRSSSRGDANTGGLRGNGSVGTMLNRSDFSSSSTSSTRHHRHGGQHNAHGHHHHRVKSRQKMGAGAEELDEMDVREDLRGWRIGEAAYS